MVILKSPDEIEKMRAAGRILASTIQAVSAEVRPGVTPKQLDAIAHHLIAVAGATPSFLGYRDYPAATCISPNEIVVHGIPNDQPLKEGDIIGLDFGVFLNGYHADSAWTFPVGEVSEATKKLLRVSEESLYEGLKQAKAGNHIGDIAAAVQKHVESNGFSIVRDLVGHGIGQSLHEEPSVPNFGKPGKGPVLKEGMTICVEPMVNSGTWKVKTLADGWTVVTADRRYSAHFEHTIAITKDGPDILTKL